MFKYAKIGLISGPSIALVFLIVLGIPFNYKIWATNLLFGAVLGSLLGFINQLVMERCFQAKAFS